MGFFDWLFGKKTPDQLRQEIRGLEEKSRSLDESIRNTEAAIAKSYKSLGGDVYKGSERSPNVITDVDSGSSYRLRAGVNKRIATSESNIIRWRREKIAIENELLSLQQKLADLERQDA